MCRTAGLRSLGPVSSRYDDLSRPPLNGRELRRALVGADSRWCEVDVVAELGSTNDELVRRSATDPRDGLVLLAEHQVGGRGRLDRIWTSPPRAGITMSALTRPAVPAARWTWVPLLSGLAVAAAVRQVAEVEAWLKWPNDVVVGDRKLAGVLVQRIDPPALAPCAVIGIGLNVSTRRDELPVETATSLVLESAATTERLTLVKAILRRLDALLGEWEGHDGIASGGLRDAYRGACQTVGRAVRVEVAGSPPETGEAVDIDSEGRLVVRTPHGSRSFSAGEVLHVRGQA